MKSPYSHIIAFIALFTALLFNTVRFSADTAYREFHSNAAKEQLVESTSDNNQFRGDELRNLCLPSNLLSRIKSGVEHSNTVKETNNLHSAVLFGNQKYINRALVAYGTSAPDDVNASRGTDYYIYTLRKIII